MKIIHFSEIDSTNDYLASYQKDFPVTVWADFQTKGRGRFGRSWAAEPGQALLFSTAFDYDKSLLEKPGFSFITLAAGRVVACFLEAKTAGSAEFWVKWPNDILLNDKKIAGILCETHTSDDRLRIVIGCGINLTGNPNPPDAKVAPGNIAKELGGPSDVAWYSSGRREELLTGLVDELAAVFAPVHSETFPENLKKVAHDLQGRFILTGRRIKNKDYQGVVRGFHPESGHLLLETNEGTVDIFDSDYEILD